MKDYVVMIDTNSEIPFEFAKENDLKVFKMPYALDEKEFYYDLGENTDYEDFFNKLKSGSKPSTSTRSAYDIEQFFKEQLEQGNDILYIGFSSQLSSHFSMCATAREKLAAEYPDRKFIIVDSLKISAPLGVLIMKAVELKNQGMGIEELAKWVEENKKRAYGWYIVDDLMYLKRGGRISGAAATIGTIMEVKPILNVGNEGKIVAHDKIKGKKRVIKYLKTKFDETVEDAKDTDVCILHAQNLEGATKLKEKIEAEYNLKSIWIQNVGPVIGSHTGPGVLALCYLGKLEA